MNPRQSKIILNIKIIRKSLAMLIPAALLLAATLYIIHQLELRADRGIILTREHAKIDRLGKLLQLSVRDVISDLDYLRAQLENEGLRNQDPAESLADNFLLFSQSKPQYHQLRILSQAGKELLRINHNNALPELIPEDQLQDKSDRYYYQEAMKLSPHHVYFSPLDLNIEHQVIEQPENPMIRLAMAVYGLDRTIYGICMLNFKGQQLLDLVAEEQGTRGVTLLVNRDGYYLYHPLPDKRWGFMYPDRRLQRIENDIPNISTHLSTRKVGQFFDDTGLTTYRVVRLHPDAEEWALIAHLTPQEIQAEGHQDAIPHTAAFTIIVFILGIITTATSIIIVRKDEMQKLVQEANERYRKQTIELEESNSIKELLLDILSHDLKNPAGAIESLTELLSQDVGPNVLVEAIRESSISINKVLKHAGTLSRIGIGEEIEFESLNLVGMIQELLHNFKSNLDGIGMEVTLSGPSTLTVSANLILSEVFSNFITNAMRYAAQGRSLTITLTEGEETVMVEFADQGDVIPESMRETIFERRQQLDKTAGKGSGLGLAIVKRIALMHHAEIGVRPNSPRGNIFYIHLPKR